MTVTSPCSVTGRVRRGAARGRRPPPRRRCGARSPRRSRAATSAWSRRSCPTPPPGARWRGSSRRRRDCRSRTPNGARTSRTGSSRFPGTSPAELNTLLGQVIDARGVQLRGVVIAEPDALVALVTLRRRTGARDHVRRRSRGTRRVRDAPAARLGSGGPAAEAHRLGGGRHRSGPAGRSRARRAAPHAHALVSGRRGRRPPAARPLRQPAPGHRARAARRARPRPGPRATAARARSPWSSSRPASGASRVIYQALAEDLASHGYLVIAVDHTGEAPVEFADGRFALPTLRPGVRSPPPRSPGSRTCGSSCAV